MELQGIQQRIYSIRETKVMFDFDLSELYDVETRTLKQAVRRNRDRFPEDFMFQLSGTEWRKLIENDKNDLPDAVKFSPSKPFAFSEQGVAMLSTVLKSKKAIQMNIGIMRAFVMLRQHLSDYKDLKEHMLALELEMDIKFEDINQAIRILSGYKKSESEQQERKRIGFSKKD